jgi:phage head maturation protease
MRIYFPIAKVDDERREVWGYASTEARDDQGEIVKREALISALGDYMKFANIREMHQLSAVGVAKEAGVDDKGLYVGARIVDDRAWAKVVEGVYKGYSIGGRITQRDPADYKTITGLVLNEISLVDRPANPEAVFDYWKASGDAEMSETRFNPPLQIWACGVPEHRHLAKADALKCLEGVSPDAASGGANLIAAAQKALASAEGAVAASRTESGSEPYGEVEYADPGYQPDGKRRYPIDNERHIRAAWNFINRPTNANRYTAAQLDQIKAKIIAAWKEKIDRAGPPSAGGDSHSQKALTSPVLRKALADVGRIAGIILDLDWLAETLAVEAAMEADNSPQPARLKAIVVELCGFLNALVAEETSEILDNADTDDAPIDPAAYGIIAMAAGVAAADLVADICKSKGSRMQQFANAILANSPAFAKAGAKHSRSDQALLDFACNAADRCIGMPGLSPRERDHMGHARDALKAAGAVTNEEATVNAARHPEVRPPVLHAPAPEFRPENTTVDSSKSVLDMIAEALGKRGKGHQALMDVAHDCVAKLTDRMCCTATKAGARHSRETMGYLGAAHDHLVAAGAACDRTAASEEETEGTRLEPGKGARSADLMKALADERAEKTALMKALADIAPRLDQLRERVEVIAHTPLPPATIAKGVAISKQQDNGGDAALSDEELAAAFARMSNEEQTLALIKAARTRPITPPAFASAKELRPE